MSEEFVSTPPTAVEIEVVPLEQPESIRHRAAPAISNEPLIPNMQCFLFIMKYLPFEH